MWGLGNSVPTQRTILLEQRFDAARQLADRVVLGLHQRRQIQRHALHLDACGEIGLLVVVRAKYGLRGRLATAPRLAKSWSAFEVESVWVPKGMKE